MSAHQFYLDSSLEEAWLQGALTFEEAWLLQDQILLQQSEELWLPEELQPLAQRFNLSQIPWLEAGPVQ